MRCYFCDIYYECLGCMFTHLYLHHSVQVLDLDDTIVCCPGCGCHFGPRDELDCIISLRDMPVVRDHLHKCPKIKLSLISGIWPRKLADGVPTI